jgi:hypothetical protein
MKRMNKAVKMIAASIVTIGLSQFAATTPAAAQNLCMSYVRTLCWHFWDEMGYDGRGDCIITEYAICVENGGPPDGYPYAGLVVRQTAKRG